MQADGRLIVFGDNQATAVQHYRRYPAASRFRRPPEGNAYALEPGGGQGFHLFRKKCTTACRCRLTGDVYTSLVTGILTSDQLCVSIYQQEGDQRIFLGSRTKEGLYVVEWKKFRVLKTAMVWMMFVMLRPLMGRMELVTPHGIVFNRDGTTKTRAV